jgi:RNA polymerase sigma-B factor
MSISTAIPPSTSTDTHASQERTAEERDLLARFQRNEDPELLEALVKRFMPLARSIARRFVRPGEPFDDLLQVASLGLVKAIQRFDAGRGTAFSTFAVPTIVGELKRYLRDCSWGAHVPRGLQEDAMRIDRAVDELEGRLGRTPSVRELAERMELSREEVLDAMQARQARGTVSLDEHFAGDEEEKESRVNALGETDERYDLVECSVSIAAARDILTERERRLLQLRFSEGLTQGEIGKRFGVSQMQVSRLLRQTLNKLRSFAAGEGADAA